MRHFAITGIGDRGLDALDHRGVAHAGDAAVAADVGRDPLERHHRDRAGVLGDLRLLGVTTSMITPPRSISASPRLTRAVPVRRSARVVLGHGRRVYRRAYFLASSPWCPVAVVGGTSWAAGAAGPRSTG